MRKAWANMVQSCIHHATRSAVEATCSYWIVLPSLKHLRQPPLVPIARSHHRWPALCNATASATGGRPYSATPPLLPSFLSPYSEHLPEFPPLTPADVHIWWLRHAPSTGLPHQPSSLHSLCTALLTSEEAAECALSQDPASMELRLLARAFTRAVLCRYLQHHSLDPTSVLASDPLHPASLVFSRNKHGKPELCHPATPLRFNLTHTPGLIGLAVAVGGSVGLDAEAKGRKTRGDSLRLARRRFSQVEIEQLERIDDPEERAALFIKLWTLKEAYVKAVGRGIAASPGLRGFSFQLEEGAKRVEFESATDVGGWEFALMQPVEGHLAAVCYERQPDVDMKESLRITSFIADASADEAAVRCSPEILAVGNSG